MRPVTDAELATLLVYSFRYALGRQSTAPSAVLDLLRAHGSVLPPRQRNQVAADAARAIGSGMAGAECDVDVWRNVIALMEAEP